jgi:cytochrome c oxidase subunit II
VTAAADTRHDFDGLAGLYLPIAVVVFVLVTGALVVFVLRYRDRGEGGGPENAPRAEIAYVVVLALVAALLVAATFHTESREDAVAARPGLVVDVVAAQWSWRFHYPRQGITRVGPFQHPTTAVVPTGTTVEFRLRSQDVIHAFFVPSLRFKRDAFPDRTTRFDLVFDHPGRYHGSCAEFCGLNHAEMDFSVRAVSPARFAAFARREAGR